MRKAALLAIIAVVFAAVASPVMAVSAADILAHVKKAEAPLQDFKAEMVIAEGNKGAISSMGNGYGDIMKLDKAVVQFQKPDKFRVVGYADSIKVTYVQNGYNKLVLASMLRHRDNVKNDPGKRQDTLDYGFLSSRLWVDNTVTVVSGGNSKVVKLKLDPKAGGKDKRHDFIWVDVKSLRLVKREKYRGSGELRTRTVFGDYEMLAGKLPIATKASLFDKEGNKLGTVKYTGVKSNTGIPDSAFSLSQK